MRRNLQILMGLIFILLFNSASSKDSRTLYFSKTPKNSVSKFLFRLASEKFHYVVTEEPVEAALQMQKLSLASHERPVVVEKEKSGCVDQYCLVVGGGDHVFHSFYDVGSEIIEVTSAHEDQHWGYRSSADFFATQVSQDQMVEHDAVLSGEKQISTDGTIIKERKKETSKKLARQYLREEYEKMGYQVREVPFEQSGYSGVNLVAEKKGKGAGFVIVSAHYDTVSSPGADDDASGVVTSLALAKAFSGSDLKNTIQFVAFDYEEVGLVGSRAYASQLNETGEIKNLLGVFQVEMTGYNPQGNGGIHIIDCNENTSAQLSGLVESAISQQGLSLKRVDACTDRSDHAAFWAYNRPAIVVSENFFGGEGNPCYHRTCDVQQKLDFKYMAQIAQALLGAVSSIVLN